MHELQREPTPPTLLACHSAVVRRLHCEGLMRRVGGDEPGTRFEWGRVLGVMVLAKPQFCHHPTARVLNRQALAQSIESVALSPAGVDNPSHRRRSAGNNLAQASFSLVILLRNEMKPLRVKKWMCENTKTWESFCTEHATVIWRAT